MSYENKEINTSNNIDLEEGEISNEIIINPEKNIIDEQSNNGKTPQEEEESQNEEEHQNFFHKMAQNSKESKEGRKFLNNKREKSPSLREESPFARKQATQMFVKKPCQYHMNGFCTKGNYCKFSHDTNANSSNTYNSSNQTTYSQCQFKNLKRDLCKYYVNGNCLKGDNCTFSHTLKDFPCKTFQLTGLCDNKDGCKFSHKKLNQDEMMKFIKDNEQAILDHKSQHGSTKIDSYFKLYMDNKSNQNINPPWRPPGNYLQNQPLNMPMMGMSMVQQQKNIMSTYPMYPNNAFNCAFMPFFNMNENMMLPNQFPMQNYTPSSNSFLPINLQTISTNSSSGDLNSLKEKNKENKKLPSDDNSNHSPELNTPNLSPEESKNKNNQNNDSTLKDEGNNHQTAKILKNEKSEEIFRKIVEVIKHKTPQDPRIQSKK